MLTNDIHTAIKKVVEELKPDILKSPTLVSILSDYHAFNVHDPLLAEKKVAISTLAASSYVDKLLKWKKQSGILWQAEDAQWVEELCKKQGLKRNLVGIIADAMKEAIGLEVTFTEFSNPKKMLASEVRKYETALKKLVSTYTDQLGIKGAFYSTSANTELYRLEGHIKILAQAANSKTYDDKWIAVAKKKVIDGLSITPSQRTQILNDTISHGLEEYNKIIEQQKRVGINGSAMFDKADVDRMKEIAEKVNYAYRILPHSSRLDVDKDVRNAKNEVSKCIQQQKVQAELDKAKSDYKQLLNDALVIERDCLDLSSAHFDYDRQKEIIALEHKIASYAKELSVSSNTEDWFNNEKNQLIEKHSTSDDQMHMTARRVLSTDGVSYAKFLDEQTALGKKGKKSFEDISQLTKLADRLNRAFEIIEDKQRIDVNKDVADARLVIRSYRRKVILIISSVITIILMVVAMFAIDRINYNKYRAEIEAFNNTITEGDNALSNGNTVDALRLYKEAKEGYTVDYKLNHYSEVAIGKIETASEKIYTEYTVAISKSLASGKCKEAKQKYEELMTLNISTDLTTYSNEFTDSFKKAIEESRDKLLKSISNNKGKPTKEDLAELDNLLYCMPDDYYLNLIKSKMK